MPYRLRYECYLDWVGTGQSAMGGQLGVIQGSEAGGSQTLWLGNTPGGQNIVGTGTGGALATGNITTITNAMASDISTQLNLTANLAKAQGWATGGL
jgi:hypothetical protein